MSEAALIALIQFGLKFGLDAAVALAKASKNNSIDDAIAALEKAASKTAQDYLDEAGGTPAPGSPLVPGPHPEVASPPHS